ncbi:Beta-galactosidase [Rasamsonia emersonii CBS 393.64]|uniref:Beta-galactosidase n=1 Tax=Rasamsonia emersonii (strain ATCC 16479 / CBS 393.64 / IMI 116815) TaxID=1408163 RepID=A0A0F4YES9_RASE3|nr:Beta-galactosidase [Rasamsonia emersonii CBS 393.64]KKA16128.1 Beta-galactosidase [Rasamsonia emersonii CBS 393.64]
MVFVNGQRVGVIDRIYETPATVQVSLQKGRCAAAAGIVGNVTVGGTVLTNWAMHSLQLDELPISVLAPAAPPSNTSANIPPLFYRGLFQVDNAEGKPALNLDTFLSLPDGVKGVVWVNGHKLGRYWRIGPQQSL